MRRGDIVVPGDEANCTRDMDESIGSVENSQCGLVTGHEPMLDGMFGQGEEEANRAKLLELENGQAMGLGNSPDGLGEDLLGEDLGHAVEEVGDDPIEHFDEKREFLKYATVDVVGKARGIGCVYSQPTASSPFG